MKIIRLGIISKIKGGKGTADRHYKRSYGAESVRFSTPLREMLACLHVPDTRDNLQWLSYEMRRRFGEEVIGSEIISRLNLLTSAFQLIDGIRRPADAESLRRAPYFRSVYVRASARTRWLRQLANPENPGDENMAFGDFLVRDAAEPEREIDKVGQMADFIIDNDGISEEEYLARLDAIAAELKAAPDPPGT